jgi:excisionase family DNA binding protein
MHNIFLTKEVAEMLRVSEEYVRELIRQRKIKAYKEGRRGGYRITSDAVKRYIDVKHKEAESTHKGR